MDDIVKPASDGKSLAIIVLGTIQDLGNLGTIIRAGEGTGITGIVMNHDTADIYNLKVIYSTMGSMFGMPFVYADGPRDARLLMKNKGVCLFAVHLRGMNNYDQGDHTDDAGSLIGSEANGLTGETTSLADCLVKIPMEGKVESLNTTIVASALMFETARQRRSCSVPAETT